MGSLLTVEKDPVRVLQSMGYSRSYEVSFKYKWKQTDTKYERGKRVYSIRGWPGTGKKSPIPNPQRIRNSFFPDPNNAPFEFIIVHIRHVEVSYIDV